MTFQLWNAILLVLTISIAWKWSNIHSVCSKKTIYNVIICIHNFDTCWNWKTHQHRFLLQLLEVWIVLKYSKSVQKAQNSEHRTVSLEIQTLKIQNMNSIIISAALPQYKVVLALKSFWIMRALKVSCSQYSTFWIFSILQAIESVLVSIFNMNILNIWGNWICPCLNIQYSEYSQYWICPGLNQ